MPFHIGLNIYGRMFISSVVSARVCESRLLAYMSFCSGPVVDYFADNYNSRVVYNSFG